MSISIENLYRYSCDVEKEYEMEEESFAGGTFGKVYRGVRLSDKLKVAIKKFDIMQFEKSEDLKWDHLSNQKYLIRELYILANLKHPFCLNLVNFTLQPQPMIITPFMANGNLYNLIEKKDESLSTEKNCSIYALCSTMNFLHKIGIIHRDLKPHNVFINDNKDICVADFGLSRKLNESLNLTVGRLGSILYMAPELIRFEEYTNSVDVFSFGVIYYQFFTLSTKLNDKKKKPSDGSAFLSRIARGIRFVQPSNMSDAQYKLYLDCTNQDDNKRPSFESLTEMFENDENLWLNGVDKDEFLKYVDRCKKIHQNAFAENPELSPAVKDNVSLNLSRSARMAKSKKSSKKTVEKHFTYDNPDDC